MLTLRGTYPALVTPFCDGEVDEAALRALVEHVIEGGVDGLVPCGTTGESVTLSDTEHARVMGVVVEQARGRVPVIAGAGTVSTRHTIELAKHAREVGVDGLLLVCPYYNRPTQAGLEAHFRAVLAEVPLPSVLYNIPGRTGVDLSVETLERLADVPAIVGVKEATGNVLRAQQILARCGDRFAVLSGDDALTLPMLSVGAAGVISVTANLLPRSTSEVCRAWQAGDAERARALHLALLPVHEAMFLESNPGPVKMALARAGKLAPEVRLPLVWPTEDTARRIEAVLTRAREAGL
jgi:4-hydroxy-tetrahydrodipicolinate synthase